EVKTLYAVGQGKKLKQWQIQTGQMLPVPWAEKLDVYRLAVSPDGTLLAIASKDKVLRVFDAQSGTLVKSFQSPVENGKVRFTDDGKTMVWISHSRFIKHDWYDVATWRALRARTPM